MRKIALLKLCRCGKRIDYIGKYCDKCTIVVAEEKKDGVRKYDKNVRYSAENKKFADFYHSPAWINLSEVVKLSRNGIDIYSYYINDEIEEATISHHLREIKKDGWSDRLNKDKLIGLSHSSHEKIHRLMKKDYEGTIRMLERLMKRWEKEFG